MEETIDRYPVPGNPDFHLGQVEENVTLSRTYPALSNLPNNRPNLPDRKQAQTRRFHTLSLCLYIYIERKTFQILPLFTTMEGRKGLDLRRIGGNTLLSSDCLIYRAVGAKTRASTPDIKRPTTHPCNVDPPRDRS